jgi:hypothetical protein
MRYFWIKSILIVNILCGYGFGYPIGFDEAAFNNLKWELLKRRKPGSPEELATQIPFYVAVVTRTGKEQLTNEQFEVLSAIFHGIIMNRTPMGIPTEQGAIPADIKSSQGIVIFNEYFFSGKSPDLGTIPSSQHETVIGQQLSKICPRYIYAINSLTRSPGEFTQPGEIQLPANSHVYHSSQLEQESNSKSQQNVKLGYY